MGEYNSEELNEEQNDEENELNEKEEMGELNLENEFEPLDEDFEFFKDLGNKFEPANELKSNNEKFEENFIPKDERDINEFTIKIINEKEEPVKEQEENLKLGESTFDYKDILDERIQKTFKHYFDKSKQYPNDGRNLRKNFIKWVEKIEKDKDIINKIKNIQKNHEISNFIEDKIQNSDLSQNEIANKLNETGLSVCRKTIGNYALNKVFKSNKVEYNKRFDKSLNPEIKGRIINRLNEEVEKYTAGDHHDSLYKIAKDFPEVSKTMIDKIAKNEISQDAYEKIWPSTSGTVDPKTKQNIKNTIEKEVQDGKPRSLRNISEDFPSVSTTTISDLAKEIFPDKYEDLWPAIEKISEETKVKIMNTIKNEAQKEKPRSLRDIHKDFPEVGADTIKRLAHQAVPKKIHDKVWSPLTFEIPKEKTLKIIRTLEKEIKKLDPLSLNEIGKKYKVSTEYVRKLAKNSIPKEIYEKIWKPYDLITADTKKEIINDIKNTKLNISEIAEKNRVSQTSVSNISQNEIFKDNLDAHRERFPFDENLEIGNYTHLNLNSLLTKAINSIPNQKYYTEPNIYFDKRRPDGLILEDNNFIYQRLTNLQTGEYLRDKLELDPKNLDEILSTQFDFTNDISNENLINKIEKYQSEDTLLLIIGTRWYIYDDIKHLPIDDRIKYPENVRVISHNLGADLIGLEGGDKDLYDKIIDFNYNRDLNSLKMLYSFDLSSIVIHNTEELKEDLIEKRLIKEDFNEYFNFEVKNIKESNRKQLGLDYFLNG